MTSETPPPDDEDDLGAQTSAEIRQWLEDQDASKADLARAVNASRASATQWVEHNVFPRHNIEELVSLGALRQKWLQYAKTSSEPEKKSGVEREVIRSLVSLRMLMDSARSWMDRQS